MNIAVVCMVVISQSGVNRDAAIMSEFQDRVAAYVKAPATPRAGLPPLKPTDSREAITQRAADLARLIQQARPTAAQSDFFTPAIATEFRRLIGIALQGLREHRVRKMLEH